MREHGYTGCYSSAHRLIVALRVDQPVQDATVSADHYDWLVAAARRTHRTAEAVDVVVDAVRRSEMDPEHACLDELLK